MKMPRIIPPKSLVRLARADKYTPAFRNLVGKQYRIGYYNVNDGLETIWLVDEEGRYVQTIDKETLRRYFLIEHISNETDFHGQRRRRLREIPKSRSEWKEFPPPLTLLQLRRPAAFRTLSLIKDQVGQYYQVGYYTPNDGLETVWIVNEDGEYYGTIERKKLKDYFRIVKPSEEAEFCGLKPIPPLPESQRLEALRMDNITNSRLTKLPRASSEPGRGTRPR